MFVQISKLPSRRAIRLRGFSLIETVVTMGVVALGLLATLSVLVYMRTQNRFEQEQTRAHQLVCDEMERLKAKFYHQLRPATSSVKIWDNDTPGLPDDDVDGELRVILKSPQGAVLEKPPKQGGLVEVEITLAWTREGGGILGKEMRETLVTYIAP